MGTGETRSKASSGSSSPSPENDKNELREALCALKGGAPENGVGFSGHRNRGLGDGDVGIVEVVKSRVLKDSLGREMEYACQGLADSDMNGVSSLLKMRGSGTRLMFCYHGESGSSEKYEIGMEGGRKESKSGDDKDDQYGKIVSIDVPIAETSENKDVEIENLGDEGYGYSVGDFVWGKIRSHPWWPGRIYDSCDASGFALKLRQKNRLLVAYFGDGTFAWCHPSQLKPFEENFKDMVRQSSSRAFGNAVQEAVNEVGRLLDFKMSYSCASRKSRSEFALPLAKNAGIKEGVFVPKKGTEKFSHVMIDPAELLSQVKQTAEVIAIASTLKLEILKAWLSAFYLSRGGYRLPNYEVPQPVPGLEDNSMNETVDVGNSNGAVEAPVQGPSEDYLTFRVNPNSGELNHSYEILGNRLNHRIKQKSIAEIMGENKDVNTKSKEGGTTEKVMVKKKRKGSEDPIASKPLQKKKGMLPCTDSIMARTENYGRVGKVNSDKGKSSKLKEKKQAFGFESNSRGSKKGTNGERNPKEQNDKGYLSRERKRSKYLSPPFTIPVRGQGKEDLETESLKVSSEAQLSEPTTRAADQSPKFPEPLKFSGEVIQEIFSNGLATPADFPDISNLETPKDNDNKVIDPAKVQAPPVEVLSKVRYAAINPQIPMDITSFVNFLDFTSVFRSSLYRQGSFYSVYKKHQPGRKRKEPASELGMLMKDRKQTAEISPDNYSEPKKRRWKEMTTIMPEEKQPANAKAGKGSDEKVSTVALLVSFGPGSSLPSKSDLITLYSKFGALNESDTDVYSSTYYAQVSFLKATDAEKALKHSQNSSPFGSSEVSFKLQYLSAGSKSGDKGFKSSKGASAKKKNKNPAKTSASLSPGSEADKLNYIKQKLEDLTSMLEAMHGKSPDIDRKLRSGMKGLLEDVNKMVESSP